MYSLIQFGEMKGLEPIFGVAAISLIKKIDLFIKIYDLSGMTRLTRQNKLISIIRENNIARLLGFSYRYSSSRGSDDSAPRRTEILQANGRRKWRG